MIFNFDFNLILTTISTFSIGIPLLAGVTKRQKLVKAQRILFIYLLLSAFTEFVSSLLASKGINNLPLLHIYVFLEFILLVFFFQEILKTIGIIIKILFLIIPFFLFSILNIIYLESLFTFNTNARSLECVIFILLSIYYLYNFSNSSKELYITEIPTFGGTAAILLYFAGNLFIFGYSRLFIEDMLEYHPAVWNIHSFFNIGFNLLLAKALWTTQKV